MIYICFLFLASCPANAQLTRDPEAEKILDRLSAQSQRDYPLEIKFEYVYESLIDQETRTETGTLMLDGDRFRLRIAESDVYCDGSTMWNHMTTAGEVYISDAEDSQGDDAFFISAPGKLFTFYREGFKYQLKSEREFEGKLCHQIYLYPESLEKNYHTIKLLIGTADLRLASAEAVGKHGVNHRVMIRDYKRKARVNGSTFVFDPVKFPGLEVIDTRL
jgi:outer membrane lipoprotein-sorting protein